MKEYIDILDKNGKQKKAKVIFRFHDEENNKFYIVYKYNNEYFAAKYNNVIGTSNLDTNLNNEELKVLEKLLNKITEVYFYEKNFYE